MQSKRLHNRLCNVNVTVGVLYVCNGSCVVVAYSLLTSSELAGYTRCPGLPGKLLKGLDGFSRGIC